MNLILILFHPFSIQGREPSLNDFVKKTTTTNFSIGLYSDIYRQISLKLGVGVVGFVFLLLFFCCCNIGMQLKASPPMPFKLSLVLDMAFL